MMYELHYGFKLINDKVMFSNDDEINFKEILFLAEPVFWFT